MLAASLVLVVVLTLVVAVIAATTTTNIRQVFDGAAGVVPMSECRTTMSESRTLRMPSLLSAALWAQRRAPTIASRESTASPDRDFMGTRRKQYSRGSEMILRWTVTTVAGSTTRLRKIIGARDGIAAWMRALDRQLGGRRRLANQGGIVTVLAASLVLVVVLTVVVALNTTTTTTSIRRASDGVVRIPLMSDYRTMMSDLRTLRMLSLLGAALWAQRPALMTASRESTTSPDRDARPIARSRSPCSAWSEPGNRAHQEQPATVAPEPEASY